MSKSKEHDNEEYSSLKKTYPFTRAKSTIILSKLIAFWCIVSLCSHTSANEFQRFK
jgi:hypothetical protein